MKKLMTMIAAVAMSFGLFAADATPFATSFEAEIDDGASGTTFTPGEGWTAWDGASFTLGTDGADRTLPYVAETSMARRDLLFTGGTANNDYLKLETGSNELLRSIGGKIYLDQLVQFTGFEEVQTNLVAGTKIAVWMSGIETEGVDGEDDYVAGETNLYVTCGKVALDGTVEQVALKLDGVDYEVGKWYRLTIKSLGNIYTTAGSDSARAGFVVYIDGKQVKSSDADAKALIPDEWKSEMDPTAKGLLLAGKLFTAIDTKDANFATAGYKGIGAIDDIILDNDGPDFCQAVEVTIDPVTGAIIKKVLDGEGNEVTAKSEGVYDIAPGAFQIVWVNDEGYITFEKTINHTTDDIQPIDDSAALEEDIKPVVVEVNYDGTNTVAYADAPSALAAVAAYTDIPGNAVAVDFKQGVTNEFYAFDTGTKIAISDDYVAPEEEAAVEEEETEVAPIHSLWDITAGNVTFLTGLENNKIVTIDDDHVLTFAGTMKAGSSITAKNIVTQEGAIALDPYECSVLTLNDNLDAAFVVPTGYTLGKYTFEDDQDPLYGWTQYYLDEIVIEPVCEIDGEPYETLDAAIEAAEAGQTIKLLDNISLTAQTLIDKAITLDLAEKALTYAGCSGLKFTADGTVSNGTVTVTVNDTAEWYSAICFNDAGGLVKDVTVNAGNAKYGVVTECHNDEDFFDATVACEGVTVTGSGLLFYCESEKMTLDAGCSATQTGLSAFGGADYSKAVAASWLGQLTINGGTYSGEQHVLGTMTSPATITINGGKFTGDVDFMDISGGNKTLGEAHTIKIYAGNFTDDSINEDYLANPVDAGYERAWVTGDFTGYVKPGAEAITYNITYTVVDEAGDAVAKADYSLDATAFPETYTVEDAITFDSSKVTIVNTEKYEAVKSIAPASIALGTTGEQPVTITLTKKAADEPKNPEEPFDPPPGKTAEQYAAELKANPAALKAIVKAPTGVTGDDIDTYKACFTAVASGNKVMLVLDEEAAKTTIVPKLNTAEASIVGGNFSGTVTVEVIPGLYYGIAAQAEVGAIKGADAVEWVQATSANKASFTLPVPEVKVGDVKSDKAFFQIKCTDVTTK